MGDRLPSARLLLLVSLASIGGLIGCAKDAGLETDSESTTSEGGSPEADGGGVNPDDASAWPESGGSLTSFGSPCTDDSGCDSMQCTDIGQNQPNQVCTEPCGDGQTCPDGGYCIEHPVKGYLCIPDTENQCAQCLFDIDCPNIGDRCLVSPKIDRFCARDCSVSNDCPSGMTCVELESYSPGSGSDAGATDAGMADAGEAGSNMESGTTKPVRVCVPENGGTCGCDAKRDGVEQICTNQSNGVTCEGTEVCNGTTGAWEGCTATTPQPEICDGADNDCNGMADEGEAETLCASQGTLANATWACNQGQCEIGECDPGWAFYPPQLPVSAGCPCPIEIAEPNDTCADASDVGTASDNGQSNVNIQGRLTSDQDVDWYRFQTVDTDEGNTNSYHVKITFAANPQNEFEFAVIRGDTCAVPDAAHSGLTEYDWCVDGVGTGPAGETIGEQNCSATGPIHCGPHDTPYLIRVSRKPGAPGTCEEYRLLVTAQGDFTSCDFSQTTGACDLQVDQTTP